MTNETAKFALQIAVAIGSAAWLCLLVLAVSAAHTLIGEISTGYQWLAICGAGFSTAGVLLWGLSDVETFFSR